jgi:1,4-alpha-glucan branching enzyme
MAGVKGGRKTGTTVSSRKKAAPPRSGAAAGEKRFAKRYLKTRPVCRVSFRLPAQAAPGDCSVHIAGDFNGWDPVATPMSQLKSGDYGVTVDLERGRDYRFRYLIDGCRWENDWSADRYDPNPHGGFDSVVVV